MTSVESPGSLLKEKRKTTAEMGLWEERFGWSWRGGENESEGLGMGGGDSREMETEQNKKLRTSIDASLTVL